MDVGTAATGHWELRRVMVDRLRDWGLIRTPPVESALRAVPRHLFVPEATPERAYANDAVVTRCDSEGVAISSASSPGVVAGMLEQLDVQPGQRVLEIGAGTGYNAALLSFLVGPAGQVTTVDINPDVVAEASRNLAEVGCGEVSVICGDGEFAHPDGAPYERIIITAGAWDLPPAWADQLAEGGRLVVPLRMRGLTRTIAFERTQGCWRSRSMTECGFMPLQGAGGVAEHNTSLGERGGIVVRTDDGRRADAAALNPAFDHPAKLCWPGVRLPRGELTDVDFYLADLDGFCRLIVRDRRVIEDGFVEPVNLWGSMGVFDHDTFVYLTRRALDGTEQSGFELGVCAYGPGSDDLAERVADRLRAWDQDRASTGELRVEVCPLGAGDADGARMIIDKRHNRVIVHPSGSTETGGRGRGTRAGNTHQL